MEKLANQNQVSESYVHVPGQTPFSHASFPDQLDGQAQKHPDREALVFWETAARRRSLSFGQWREKSLHLAAVFLRLSIRSQERRALLVAPNSLDYVVVVMALARLGVNVILLKYGTTSQEIDETMKKYRCNALIYQLSAGQEDPYQLRQDSTDPASHEQHVIFITLGDVTSSSHEVHRYCDLTRCEVSEEEKARVLALQTEIQMEDALLAFMTSGSTGNPKAVQANHFQFVQATLTAYAAHRLTDSSRSV
ncbi:acyl-CoA synthetase family member 2, mitochondrial-like [Lingula anatina]|uniref:Acyl-CoA synthetase family member 2, mitochondrial-like n=1 Tax=Lingula anatina TaxID=7574 RepID=A0A1S3HPS2_LINAN|nr:acyl-CoA synthetase family member 2, mitochondrial-like [Lingula anatina]|eukprot:XP_013388037.1 acyl-CoA synthetase family member 2, mitochondrial-like [Lingula anatina]